MIYPACLYVEGPITQSMYISEAYTQSFPATIASGHGAEPSLIQFCQSVLVIGPPALLAVDHVLNLAARPKKTTPFSALQVISY